METKKNKRILVIDNYDSFTFNLVHLLHECDQEVSVWRNDKIHLDDVDEYDRILLSPGPGVPKEAGILMDLIRRYSASKKILGVCLGQQAIAEVFGGDLINLERPVHGIASEVTVVDREELLFQGIPETFMAGRYHSWAVSSQNFPSELNITALDSSGVIMALSHQTLDVRGVQFHPESILSEFGKQMISNWLKS